MRVFVAGASGAIGRPLVPALGRGRPRGHRDDPHEPSARRGSAPPARSAVVCDVFDARGARTRPSPPRGRRSSSTSSPRCRPKLDPREKGIYDANNRIRSEGTRNLVAAAQARRRAALRRPEHRLHLRAGRRPGQVRGRPGDERRCGASSAARSRRRSTSSARRCGAEGMEGLVLRYGFFYGPGHVLRRRRPPGARGAPPPLSDRRRRARGVLVRPRRRRRARRRSRRASAAPRASTTSATTSRRRLRDWLPVYAEAVGAKPPLRVPKLARAPGRRLARRSPLRPRMRGCSNAQAKARARLAAAVGQLARRAFARRSDNV